MLCAIGASAWAATSFPEIPARLCLRLFMGLLSLGLVLLSELTLSVRFRGNVALRLSHLELR